MTDADAQAWRDSTMAYRRLVASLIQHLRHAGWSEARIREEAQAAGLSRAELKHMAIL